jgi:hypothetical protein
VLSAAEFYFPVSKQEGNYEFIAQFLYFVQSDQTCRHTVNIGRKDLTKKNTRKEIQNFKKKKKIKKINKKGKTIAQHLIKKNK